MLTEDKRRKDRGDPQLKDWTLERQKLQELGESRCENFMDGIFRVSLLPQPFVITAPHSSRLAFFRLGVIHWSREGRETNYLPKITKEVILPKENEYIVDREKMDVRHIKPTDVY